MKFLIAVVLVLLAFPSSFAQALDGGKTDGTAKPDERPAQELYEDANGYLGRRFQEFNKKNLAYDPKLEAQTKKRAAGTSRQKRRDTQSAHATEQRRSLLPRHAVSRRCRW